LYEFSIGAHYYLRRRNAESPIVDHSRHDGRRRLAARRRAYQASQPAAAAASHGAGGELPGAARQSQPEPRKDRTLAASGDCTHTWLVTVRGFSSTKTSARSRRRPSAGASTTIS
jgi:hypothetical protein